jgi:hypothetical protein
MIGEASLLIRRHSISTVLVAGVLSVLAIPALAQVPAQAPPPETAAPTASDWTSNPFFTDWKAGTMVRSSYFDRTKPNNSGPSSEAWGIGGWLYGQTGELAKTLSFGAALYYVGKLYAPDGHGGDFMLTNEQEGYSTLGEGWMRARFGDHVFTVGRQALSFGWNLDGIYRYYNRFDGSFIGRRDIRGMHPLDFEAATLTGKFLEGNVRYYSGWAWAMRQTNSSGFDDLGTAAFMPEKSDGMAFAGAQWKINNDLMLQGSYHFLQNLAHMAWVDLDKVFRMGDGRYLRFDTQYIYEKSDRNLPDFPTDGPPPPGQVLPIVGLKTWNWNGYVEARWWPWWIPYGMIGVTGDGDEIRAPYSLGPSYLVQRVGENSKAGEHTWIVGTTFDFASLGAPGLSFDVNYGQRTHRHMQNDSSKPLADWDELATDLVYTLPESARWAKGIRMRVRWAKVWESGPQFSNNQIVDISQSYTDFRVDFQWLIPFR